FRRVLFRSFLRQYQTLLNSIRGISSAGRAPGLQPGGHRFEPGILHQPSPAEGLRGLRLGKLRKSAGNRDNSKPVAPTPKRWRHSERTERGFGAPRVKRATRGRKAA